MAHFSFAPGPRQCAYWKFNVKLLQDASLCSSFKIFWERWTERKQEYGSLRQWWDVGKVHVRVLCQQYTAFSSAKSRRVLEGLEKSIREVEAELVGEHTEGQQQQLAGLRRDLVAFFQSRARGALVRARFNMLREMDAPSSFFFGLEKQCVENKQMHCLRLADGRVTSV